MIFFVLPLAAAGCPGNAIAAVEIVDARDTLDKTVLGPDLMGGVAENAFNVYVADREVFDSNVYRVPSDANLATLVGNSASKRDHINSPAAGLDGQWILGRQVFQLDLSADDNRYSQNTNLNNVSSIDKLLWNWGLGNVLSGQVGADFFRSVVSFVNNPSYVRNVYDKTETFAAGRYQVGPHWSIYGGLLVANVSLDNAESRTNDSRQKSVDMGIELATGVADTYGIDYRYTDARYPNAIELNHTSFDPDYRQGRVRFLIKRALSDKTSIDVIAGYSKRNYGDTVIGSFSGPIWRASLGWEPTEKSQLIISTWRELQSYVTDETNYYRSTGISASPVWTVSEKIKAALVVSREYQAYIGSSPITTNQLARRDTVNVLQGNLTYIPTRALSFDASYRHEQRDSTQALRTYTDGLASVGMKFLF